MGERLGFGGNLFRRLRSGRAFGNEDQAGPWAAHFGERLRKHHRVVFGEPILEERVGHADGERAPPSDTSVVGRNHV